MEGGGRGGGNSEIIPWIFKMTGLIVHYKCTDTDKCCELAGQGNIHQYLCYKRFCIPINILRDYQLFVV